MSENPDPPVSQPPIVPPGQPVPAGPLKGGNPPPPVPAAKQAPKKRHYPKYEDEAS